MHISKELRDYLAAMWKIPQSGITEIRDQDVLSDGHTYDDLKIITLDLMSEYIGSRETFARAWEITCAKAYSELHPPIGTIKGKDEDEVKKELAEAGQKLADKDAEDIFDNGFKTPEPLMGIDGKPLKKNDTPQKAPLM